jgi:pimeloyl-ACP methyl ester carboxylesterase
MTPATAWFDVAPGVRLAADIFGDPTAPTVLMLHGGGQTRHAWHATATDLADAGWRAVTVDLRGHGESSHPRPPAYTLEDFAADVRGLISSIATDPIVIGASLGGIAGLLAVTESQRALAAGLILVDVAHRFQPRGGGRIVSFMEGQPDGFASLADAAEAVAAYLPHRARTRDLGGLRRNLRRNGAGGWIWHWDPEMLRQTRPLIQDQAQLSDRLTTAATRLRRPCLLVRGADSDVLTTDIAHEFIGLAANATLAEVPDAGHMAAGDNNDAFTAAISTWLQEFSAGVSRETSGDPL